MGRNTLRQKNMNTIISLLWLTHPTALNDAIADVQDGMDIDDAVAEVVTALYTDDTFNEYSEAELQAAIAETITEC